MASVDGKAIVTVSFDSGPPVTLPTEAITYLWVFSNVSLIGPAFTMHLKDSIGLLRSPAPGDGSKVTITIGTAVDNLRRYFFRLVGAPKPKGGGLEFSGVLDLPHLFFQAATFSVRGTSSEAIEKLAQELDLDTDIDSSMNDEMLWLPGQGRWGSFLATIASHGWFGDASAASVVGIDTEYVLHYKDLAKLAKTKPTHTFYYHTPIPADTGDTRAYAVLEVSRDDRTAIATGKQGYNAVTKHFDKNGELQANDKVGVTRQSNQMNMSADVKEQTGVNTMRLSPMPSPNTHANFERAAYQNIRYRATYSSKVSVLLKEVTTKLTLFAPVSLITANVTTGSKDDALLAITGLVESRTVGVYGGNYVEKIVIASQGMDSEQQTAAQV